MKRFRLKIGISHFPNLQLQRRNSSHCWTNDIRARAGDLGIVPGSMGARSFIVRGLGNCESFCSSAHGAGRKMSRTAAEKKFAVGDMVAQTQGVICRKDKDVIDETPAANKDIDQVMANQADLTEILHTLKQVVCDKG